MNYKLLASSPTEAGILDCINRYFYSKTFSIKDGGVYNSKGLLYGFRVIQKGKRYRFEVLI